MLSEAKLNCQAMDPHYEPELCRLIQAALTVLRTRGISVAGDFSYKTGTETETGLPIVTSWRCTVADDWIRTAALTYVKAKFPGTKDPEMYMRAFVDTVNSMVGTTGYGLRNEDGSVNGCG